MAARKSEGGWREGSDGVQRGCAITGSLYCRRHTANWYFLLKAEWVVLRRSLVQRERDMDRRSVRLVEANRPLDQHQKQQYCLCTNNATPLFQKEDHPGAALPDYTRRPWGLRIFRRKNSDDGETRM